jgi:hypothetical protein
VQAKASTLVTTGLYSRIRNPIYVFGGLAIAGFMLWANQPWLLLFFVVLIPMQVWRSRVEARVLTEKFGASIWSTNGRRGFELGLDSRDGPSVHSANIPFFWRDRMHSVWFGEFMGTLVLVLLGNGVCAGVTLRKSYAADSGWMVITTGWALAVLCGVLVAQAFGSPGANLNPAITLAVAVSAEIIRRWRACGRRSCWEPWAARR